MSTLAYGQAGGLSRRTDTNGRLEVLDAIREDIASLVRSGGKDSPECERISIATLAELRRLRWKQAVELWNRYTA